jgi:hypothetical protein
MTCSKRFAWLSICDAVLFSSAHGIVLLTPISGCQTGQKSAGASKASETNRLRDSQYRGMPTKDGKRDREIMRT